MFVQHAEPGHPGQELPSFISRQTSTFDMLNLAQNLMWRIQSLGSSHVSFCSVIGDCVPQSYI